MRIKTVANFLVGMGAVVGIAAVAVIALDYSPSLTPEMVKLLFYKGLGAAAVGLIVVGTIIGRIARVRSPDMQAELHDSAFMSEPKITSGTPEVLLDSHQREQAIHNADQSKSASTIESKH